MTWKNVLIPPVAIYAVIFLFISGLIGAEIDQTALWVWIVSLVISIVGLWIATGYAKPSSMQQGLMFGLAWLALFVVLDLVLTVPFTGMEYFSDWKTYVPYALTVLIPTFLRRT